MIGVRYTMTDNGPEGPIVENNPQISLYGDFRFNATNRYVSTGPTPKLFTEVTFDYPIEILYELSRNVDPEEALEMVAEKLKQDFKQHIAKESAKEPGESVYSYTK